MNKNNKRNNVWVVAKRSTDGNTTVVQKFATRETARVWVRKTKSNKKTKNARFVITKRSR